MDLTQAYSEMGLPAPVSTERRIQRAKMLGALMDSYLQSLSGLESPPEHRARDPFSNHPWVFASAMVTAIVASQAPFTVFRETPDMTSLRRQKDRSFCYRSGTKRRAIKRWGLTHRRPESRLFSKGLDPLFEHPINDLLDRPNPLQNGSQLFQFTYLWLALRGEIFWVTNNPNRMSDDRVLTGLPEELWPVSPDAIKPVYEAGQKGSLVAWKMRAPKYFPTELQDREFLLNLNEVIQFKFPNPFDPVRGMSRLTSVASSIEMDMLSKTYQRSILKNQGVPKGLITHDDGPEDEEDSAFRRKWKQEVEGPENAGKTAFLWGGYTYQALGLTEEKLGNLEHMRNNRDEILGVLQMPRSVLSLTEFVNYATQLGQDKNFWDKTILPIYRMMEETMDGSVLFDMETDNLVGLYDLKNIEALRAGVEEKVTIAERLCSDRLHVPPRVAYDIVGLEVPEYEGDETALVGGLFSPAGDILSDDESSEDDDDGPTPIFPFSRVQIPRRKVTDQRRWKQFIVIEEASEGGMRRGYRSWISQEKRVILERFEEQTKQIDIFGLLGTKKEMMDRLKAKSRPTYAGTLENVWEFTLDDIGIPTFDIDDPRIMEFFDKREKLFLDKVTDTYRRNLTNTISEGLRLGETEAQLRLRISEVLRVSSSSAKVHGVVRTEVPSLMNGIRDEMFKAQGFKKAGWVNAADEIVRPPHVTFGEAADQEIGFNYLTLVGEESLGVLAHPGDIRAPVHQIARCRCFHRPRE